LFEPMRQGQRTTRQRQGESVVLCQGACLRDQLQTVFSISPRAGAEVGRALAPTPGGESDRQSISRCNPLCVLQLLERFAALMRRNCKDEWHCFPREAKCFIIDLVAGATSRVATSSQRRRWRFTEQHTVMDGKAS
jgi:hypothetical protein